MVVVVGAVMIVGGDYDDDIMTKNIFISLWRDSMISLLNSYSDNGPHEYTSLSESTGLQQQQTIGTARCATITL